jgi:hypothetical protein
MAHFRRPAAEEQQDQPVAFAEEKRAWERWWTQSHGWMNKRVALQQATNKLSRLSLQVAVGLLHLQLPDGDASAEAQSVRAECRHL